MQIDSKQSGIYSGTIRHRRHAPVKNAFTYKVFMLYLDLNEIEHLFDDSRLWSYEKPNLACWRRRDYIGPRDLPLEEAVRFRVKRHTGGDVNGPIRMLCHACYLGYCYNPVVFYYCFNEDDTALDAIIAEITNTPWGERHAYVLTESMNLGTETRKEFFFPKSFHVSPFMPMDIDYNWRFTTPGQRISIHMRNLRDDALLFDATLNLQRQPFTAANLRRTLWHNPSMTMKVVTMIHWQALKLWWKRTPFFDHPARRDKTEKDPYATQDKASRQKGA
jgi:DUF1365 family protein